MPRIVERTLFMVSLALLAWALHRRYVVGDVTVGTGRFVLLTAAMVMTGAAALARAASVRAAALMASVLLLVAFFRTLAIR